MTRETVRSGLSMIEFTGLLEVDRPPNQVFEQLADMAELHQWNPNVRSSSRLRACG